MQNLSFVSCDSCLVYGTNNKPLSEARVIDTGSSLTLIMNNPKLKEVKVNVIVDFRDVIKGIIKCQCQLHIRPNMQVGRANEKWAADCKVLKVIETVQRHRDLRLPVMMSVLCTGSDNLFFRVKTVNISAHGMMCTTKKVMPNGTVFKFEYTFGGVLCKLQARVLHGRYVNGECCYGCQFVDLKPEYEQALRRYVFSMEESAGLRRKAAV